MPAWLLPLLQILLGAGVLTLVQSVVAAIIRRRHARTPSARALATVSEAQASVIVLAQTRDELVEDNQRLRSEMAELRTELRNERTQHAAELAELWAKVRMLTAEVEQLRSV